MTSYRVLIVDDQRDVRRMLRASLETMKYDLKVVDVPSGEEAMLVLSRQPVDLMVADIRLPGITGLELKDRALLRNPGLKLILITGLTEPRLRRQAENAGADAFFLKPIEVGDFLEAVEHCLGTLPAQGKPATGRLGRDARGDAPSAPPAEPGAKPVEEPPTRRSPAKEPPAPTPGIQEPPTKEPPAEEPQPEPEKKTEKRWWRVEKPAPLTLSDRIANLRQETQALMVALLDGHGGILAQAGSLPRATNEEELFGALMPLLAQGYEVARFLGRTPPNDAYYLEGSEQRVFLTHLGAAVGMVLVTPSAAGPGSAGDAEAGPVEKVIGAMCSAAPEIRKGLSALGMALDVLPEPLPELLAARPPAPALDTPPAPAGEQEPVPVADGLLEDLDALFGKAESTPAAQDLDSFWDNVAEEHSETGPRKNAITFEQALELGLDLEKDE